MGLFKAKDPHKHIYTSSGGRMMSRDIDGTSMKYLILVGFSPKPENRDVRIASLDMKNLSDAFGEFSTAFMTQFNKQFPEGPHTRVGLDYVSLPEWPNYNIAKPDHPSQIGQSDQIETEFAGNPISKKRTCLLVFTEANNVGKFYALRQKSGRTFMEEIFDLKVSKEDEIGMALWTVSPSAANVYASFFMDIYFTAGSEKVDKLILGLPTRQASLPYGMALAGSGLK